MARLPTWAAVSGPIFRPTAAATAGFPPWLSSLLSGPGAFGRPGFAGLFWAGRWPRRRPCAWRRAREHRPYREDTPPRPGEGGGGQGRGRGAKGKEKRGRSRVTMKGGCALVFGFKVAVGAGLRASLFFFFFHDKGLLVRCDFLVSRAFLPPRTLRPSYSLCFPLSCDFMGKNEAPICKWDGYI